MEPARWEPFLRAFVTAMNCTVGMFWISRTNPPRLIQSVTVGPSDETKAQIADPTYRDPWFSRVDIDAVPVGAILRSNEICPDEEVVGDECYQRVCLPANVHYGGGVTLERSATVAAGICFNRPRSDGPLTEDELSLWRFLIPHLRAAVGVYTARCRHTSQRDAMLLYFNDLGHGVILISAANEVLACNRQARTLMDRAECLRLKGDSLVAVDSECNRLLKQAIHLSGGGMLPPSPAQLALLRRDGSPAALARVLPVGPPGSAQVAKDAASAVIFLVDLGSAGELDPSPLRTLYAFTESEARVACLIASGHSLAEAAAQSHVSIHTVRSHVQRALEKTGADRQSELAVMVLKICRPNQSP